LSNYRLGYNRKLQKCNHPKNTSTDGLCKAFILFSNVKKVALLGI